MRFLTKGNRQHAPTPAGSIRGATKMKGVSICVCCLVVAAGLGITGQLTSQAPEQSAPSVAPPVSQPEQSRFPNVVSEQAKMQGQQVKLKRIDAANTERKRQITDDSALLLKLATELKTAVDKTSKDTLSIGIIRKADEIERLAHGVKEKMKLTMNAN